MTDENGLSSFFAPMPGVTAHDFSSGKEGAPERDYQLIYTPNLGRGIAHHWAMWHNPTNAMVGQMHQHENGEVSAIEIHPKHRRQGLATMMWNAVKDISASKGLPAPKHSAARTPLGDKFAKSIGGDLPKRQVVSQAQFKDARW